MKPLGFVFVTLGILALCYGGISYSREKTLFESGTIKAGVTERQDIPLSPMVAGIAIVGGLLLLMAPRPRTA